jgi:hypothetical protein
MAARTSGTTYAIWTTPPRGCPNPKSALLVPALLVSAMVRSAGGTGTG